MSFVISKESLKEEGKSLLKQLRGLLKEFEDIFRMDYDEAFFETINKIKENLKLAESVAICEQIKREGKPDGDTYHWYNDYLAYRIIKTKDEKDKLLSKAPKGFFCPDLESIARILDLINLDMETDEDLFFDVSNFLKKYEAYKVLELDSKYGTCK